MDRRFKIKLTLLIILASTPFLTLIGGIFITFILSPILSLILIILEFKQGRDIRAKQKIEKEILFQDLYDKLNSEYHSNLQIEIKDLLNRIGIEELINVLDMKILILHYEIELKNPKWEIKIGTDLYHGFITIFDLVKNFSYDYNHSDNNGKVKEEFLNYYRDCCKRNKFKIKT